MSRLQNILLDLQDSDVTREDLGALAKRNPGDPILEVNRHAIERRRTDLERELNDLLKRQQLDLIQYEITRAGGEPGPASGFAHSILTFQELLTSVFDSVRPEGDENHRKSEELAQLSALVFANAERGSVMLSLSIPNERLLLIGSDLDTSLHLVFDLLDVRASGALREIAKRVGPKATAALYRWAANSATLGLEHSIHWQKTAESGRSAKLSPNEALLLKTTIEATHDEVAQVIDVDCQLISFDGLTRTFLVEASDGRQITGTLAEEFTRGIRPAPNVSYHACLLRIAQQHYASGEQTVTWILRKLSPRR